MASQPKIAKTDTPTQSETLTPISLVPRSYWCQTKAVVDQVNFEWTIERFGFFCAGDTWGPFTSTDFDGKFSLSLSVDKFSVNIRLLSSVRLGYPIRVEIALIKGKCTTIYQQANCFLENTAFPYQVFGIAKNHLKPDSFLNEEITISCKIQSLNSKPLTGTATERYLHKSGISDNYQDVILRQLEEMLEKMVLSDVTFNIRGRTFAAHKTILAMRSPVFAAMFQHPTKEAESSQVEVEDIDPDVFQEILRFIYTGRTQSTVMNKMAPGLLAAADKYLLDDLKTRCETHLIRQMSAVNCLEMLSFTTRHPAENLKKYAVEYFRRFPGDVMKTKKWKKMKEENPAALCDLQQMIFSTAPTV